MGDGPTGLAVAFEDPDLLSTHIRASGGVNEYRGVSVVEAPRGMLIHDCHVDQHGILTGLKLLSARGNNNLAMNQTVKQIAPAYLSGNNLAGGLLNRFKHGIRLCS